MSRRLKGYSNSLKEFRKKMAAVQRAEIRQNPYVLGKIVGKLNVFSESEGDKDEKDDEYRSVHINGCNLTRLKDSDGMYAIGDSDKKPITEFDFVYVARTCLGESDPVIETITKSGKNRYFRVSSGGIEN